MKNLTKYSTLICIILFYAGCEKNKIEWTLEKAVRLAKVITIQPSSITSNSALTACKIESDGGAAVISRGICYSKNATPLVTDNKIASVSTIGTFNVTIQNLEANSQYHIRAFATNSKGTAYGNEFTFKTLPASTLATLLVSSITYNSSICGGVVYNDGGYKVTAKGVCWSTVSSPTLNDNKTINGSDTGYFVSSLTSLSQNTTYYIRAYATNSFGTYYGNEVSFTTLVQPTVPTVTTSSIVSVTAFSALSGGNVTDIGGSAVTSRGICWSQFQNPTLSNVNTTNGSGLGNFSCNLASLGPNTLYYVRAFATNSFGTVYGNELSFTTAQISLPTITTGLPTNVTQTTASGWGNISNEGGSSITARGVCWNTSPLPTIANIYTNSGTGIGNYQCSITNLVANTNYYIRAFATNAAGTVYGTDQSFSTLPNVNTGSVYQIKQTSAQVDGQIMVNGGAGVTSRGVCWNTSPNPTVSNFKTVNGSGTGTFLASLTGLASNTTYYVCTYSYNNLILTYGNEVSFKTSGTASYVGQSYQGGKIAYILQPSDPGYIAGQVHGIIAATSDQSSSCNWGCSGSTISGADGTILGTGNQNTNDIITGCTNSGIASRICYDLFSNGYNDWYLPSRDELNKLYLNRTTVGGFSTAFYWSSSESNSTSSLTVSFNSGSVGSSLKTNNCRVRGIRSF